VVELSTASAARTQGAPQQASAKRRNGVSIQRDIANGVSNVREQNFLDTILNTYSSNNTRHVGPTAKRRRLQLLADARDAAGAEVADKVIQKIQVAACQAALALNIARMEQAKGG
jgi:hypothetical protein